jgi:hypothetical protein
LAYKDKEKQRLNEKLSKLNYRIINKQALAKANKEWYLRNKEHVLKHQAEARQTPEAKKKSRIYQREYRIRKRRELIALLGNKCKICGFSDIRAIEIDHIKGGGTADKRMISPSSGEGADRMYAYYIKRPKLAIETLQILCRNCNRIKQFENHEQSYFGDVIY